MIMNLKSFIMNSFLIVIVLYDYTYYNPNPCSKDKFQKR